MTAGQEAYGLAFVITTEQMNLCYLLAIYGPESDDHSPWRAAVHEAGHALVELIEGVDFADVFLVGDGSGEVRNDGLDVLYAQGSRKARVRADVAGALAEELVFGDVAPSAVETDLRVALARERVLEPERVQQDDEGLGRVRQAVMHVRKMLRRRRRALDALAGELLRAGRLERRECARVVRSAGTCVGMRPKFSPTLPWSELRDCDLVRQTMGDRKAAYLRARGVSDGRP